MYPNIRKLRKQAGMSQQELANALNVHQTAVSQWETSRTAPDIETLAHMAQLFDTSIDEITGRPSLQKEKGVKIPVYGNVAAGIPIEAIADIEDYEEIPEDWLNSGDFIALRIKGDSMEPRIESGDVVIVRLQSTAETGDTVIALVNGDEATCKKIKIRPEGIMLSSINTAYEPMFYSNKEIEELPVRILGVVVELRGKFKNV